MPTGALDLKRGPSIIAPSPPTALANFNLVVNDRRGPSLARQLCIKKVNGTLGFSVSVVVRETERLFVSRVAENCIVDDGRLFVGDELMSIDGYPTSGLRCKDALQLISAAQESIELEVLHNPDVYSFHVHRGESTNSSFATASATESQSSTIQVSSIAGQVPMLRDVRVPSDVRKMNESAAQAARSFTTRLKLARAVGGRSACL